METQERVQEFKQFWVACSFWELRVGGDDAQDKRPKGKCGFVNQTEIMNCKPLNTLKDIDLKMERKVSTYSFRMNWWADEQMVF